MDGTWKSTALNSKKGEKQKYPSFKVSTLFCYWGEWEIVKFWKTEQF
jgi:hypothetical protein